MRDPHFLFVHSDQPTLYAIKRMLRKEHFTCHFAANADIALQIIQQHPIAILVSGLHMTDAEGLELHKLARILYPKMVRVCLIKGANPLRLLQAINSGDIFRFIRIPVSKEELFRTLSDAMQLSDLLKEKLELTQSLKETREELYFMQQRNKDNEHKIQLLSVVDDLTGLYNHKNIQSNLDNEYFQARRYGTDFSVLMFALDDYNAAYSNHGGEFMDAAVHQFARHLKNTLRMVDLAFRVSADTFLAVLRQTSISGAQIVAARILQICREAPVISTDAHQHVTVSIGLTSYSTCKATSGRDILTIVNNQLEKAQQEGGDRIIMAD
ncbi:diguanylate cyclase domain-containing protein [Desulfosediminicola sp.]|uniref:diguanylate cyclase domain-containing protein n=1 Tax=Desulfosediminicola sp. TaxID=2886825 RepID=UPI003AF1E6DA